MSFCRTRLSAKRFIAGVGRNAPWPLLTVDHARRSAGGAAFFELADDWLGDIAHCTLRQSH